DNFGTAGELPYNRELLDHLALKFIAVGWSGKKVVRYVVLSRTSRQSSIADCGLRIAEWKRWGWFPIPQSEIHNPQLEDPENRLFGRGNRRRLEAECIRDTVLSVSGQLDLTRGGPTFPTSLAADYGYKANSPRRSIYLPMFRNALPEMLEVFDAA